VGEVKKNLPKMQAAIPDDIEVRFEFDQSPYVTRAVWGVGTEGLLGAVLTGLMVLLFLRDWRSVIVVVLNIPFALLGALVALWLTGQTINLMTLGGLALAVGILVDEATVEVENIHSQFEHTPNIARAVRRGNHETAVPRLLAMLCVLAVFIPSFFMQGAAQALFVPLSLAVGFSMVVSYFLSSTFVPVLSVWLLRHYHQPHGSDASWLSFHRLRDAYAIVLRGLLWFRWIVVPAYFAAAVALVWFVGGQLGREVFPAVDAGQFQLRLRAPTGTRIEVTEQLAIQALEAIKQEAGPENVAISVGYLGLIGSSYPINTVYLWMRGPEEAVLRVALKRDSGVRVAELKQRLRRSVPERLGDWLRQRLASENVPEEQVAERVRGIKLSFEPADIVNEVMSFGSPTPVEIAVSGAKLAESKAYADKLRAELEKFPSLCDLQFVQPLDYPAVEVKVDRQLTGASGVTTQDVANSLVAATSSSRFTVPNFWADPNTGIGYQVQVEIPTERMNSAEEVRLVPIKRPFQGQLFLQDVARVREDKRPGEYDRYNMKRVVSLTANIEGEDLGRVAGHIAQAIAAAGEPPRGSSVDVRGQVETMRQIFGVLAGGQFAEEGLTAALALSGIFILMLLSAAFLPRWGALSVLALTPFVLVGAAFALRAVGIPLNFQSWPRLFEGLSGGLILAVVVILLLLTAYFQSVRLAVVVILTAPAVIAGVGLALHLTGATLNIQSFMGAIMAIGVAVANAILLVTFAERARREGASALDAAIDGAKHRLRPILMTSCAMIAGMVPMAMALGEGGDQTAPLGRAVIGGLVAATLTTLLVLPGAFALVQGWAGTRSVSIDPDDPESTYWDRETAAP
jgi:multidrug efflux pump subunit AcrB